MSDTEHTAENDVTLTKRTNESQTEFIIRHIRAEAWDEGYEAGRDHEAFRALDREWPATTPNPYRVIPPVVGQS